jgi:hypothetical protein
MLRILLTILFFVSTVAVVAHGIMVYKVSAIASIIAEEEAPEGKTEIKNAKEFSDEKITYSLFFTQQALIVTLYKSALSHSLQYSKGFYDTPYNPPDKA